MPLRDFLILFVPLLLRFLASIDCASINWESGETALSACTSIRETPVPLTTPSSNVALGDYSIWCPLGTVLMGGGIKCDSDFSIQKSVPVVCTGDRCGDEERTSMNGALPGLIDYRTRVNSGSELGTIDGMIINRYGLIGRCINSNNAVQRPRIITAQCCPFGNGFPQRNQCSFRYHWDSNSFSSFPNALPCISQKSVYRGVEYYSTLSYSAVRVSATTPELALYNQNDIQFLPAQFMSRQTICCDFQSSGVLFEGNTAMGGSPTMQWKQSNNAWIGDRSGWFSNSGTGRCRSNSSFPINLLSECPTSGSLNSFYYDPEQSTTVIQCGGNTVPSRSYAECVTIKPPAKCPTTFISSGLGVNGYSFFNRQSISRSSNDYPGATAVEEVIESCSESFIIRPIQSAGFVLNNQFELEQLSPSIPLSQRFSFSNDQIRSLDTQKCLDVNHTMNATGSVVFSDCDATKSTQKWTRFDINFQLVPKDNPSKCLEVSDGNRAFDMAVLTVRDCVLPYLDTATVQRFHFLSPSTLMQIRTGDGVGFDDFLIQWADTPDHVLNNQAHMTPLMPSIPPNQRFLFLNNQIRSVDLQKCVDVDGPINVNGSPLIFSDCDASKSSQQWRQSINDQIRLVETGKCMDILLKAIWDCSYNLAFSNQRFSIFPFSVPLGSDSHSSSARFPFLYEDGIKRTFNELTCQYDGISAAPLARTAWKISQSRNRCYRRGDRDWNNRLMCANGGMVLGTPILDPLGQVPYSCRCDAGFILSDDRTGCQPKCGDGIASGSEQCDGTCYCNNRCKISAQFELVAPTWNRIEIKNVQPSFNPTSTSYRTPIDYLVKVRILDDEFGGFVDLPRLSFASEGMDAATKMFFLSQLANQTIVFFGTGFAGRTFQITLYPIFHSSLEDAPSMASESIEIKLPCSCSEEPNPTLVSIPVIDETMDSLEMIRGPPLASLSIIDDATSLLIKFSQDTSSNVFRYYANAPNSTTSVTIIAPLLFQQVSPINSLYRIISDHDRDGQWHSISSDASFSVPLEYGENHIQFYAVSFNDSLHPIYSLLVRQLPQSLSSEIAIDMYDRGGLRRYNNRDTASMSQTNCKRAE